MLEAGEARTSSMVVVDSSSSASQSETTDGARECKSGDGVLKYKLGGVCDLLVIMALFQLRILELVRSMTVAFLLRDRPV